MYPRTAAATSPIQHIYMHTRRQKRERDGSRTLQSERETETELCKVKYGDRDFYDEQRIRRKKKEAVAAMDGGGGGGGEGRGFLENKAAWWRGVGRDRKERIEGEAKRGAAARPQRTASHLISPLLAFASSAFRAKSKRSLTGLTRSQLASSLAKKERKIEIR
ncbi:Os03g0267901 [Oryza sativa Japonica Group]|jgi:hypothetical protein|uniref:Os03g0267901 protein n=1 Tax=Oryza sativa subsp. japonica TaxID=39947 RepID=A0A0P0VVW7_ORYSJ|nr:Os03g0267901 [Oryza sativa Japonica Group]